MEIKEFAEIIREELEKKTGLEVKLQEVRKNNNVILHGISIREPSSNIAPTIYLDSYYAVYENGVELEEIAEGIYKVYQREKTDTPFEINWFRDWEKVKGLVAYKLINSESNEEFLETVPHEKFLDLAKVYYVLVESERFGSGTILIRNTHLELWGITAEQLGVVADENTPKLFPVEIGTMCDIINSFMGDDNIISEMEEDFKKYPMYVATNHSKIFGAAIMCYPNAIKEFAEQLESDLFILPSSTHEVIIIVPRQVENLTELKDMVYEVNRTQLSAEEVLSDSVYYYSRKTDTITIA